MPSQTLLLNSEEETERFASNLAKTLAAPKVIALYGELGAGKTTFVRAFVAALDNGDKVRVRSPSYALHHEYPTTPVAHHLDLYRLSSAEQIEELGLLEVVQNSEGFVLVEWPEAVATQLPTDTIHLHFECVAEQTRLVIAKQNTKRSDA